MSGSRTPPVTQILATGVIDVPPVAPTLITAKQYIDLIPSLHADKPLFIAELTALVQPAVDIQNVLGYVATNIFDIDVAVGVQLDQIGVWVGRSRAVNIPISGVYFSFDTLNVGLDQGNWQGPFDATTGVTLLDDETYRSLLRAKIIMNTWDGSVTQAALALSLLFGQTPNTFTTIQDNQDMSMIVGISGSVPPAALIALLQNGEFDLQPIGVGITYSITSVNTSALFGFDVQSGSIAGFDVGAWSGQSGTAPGQVTQFALVSTTANNATFTWVAPGTGVGPYTYQLQYKLFSAGGYTPAPVTANTTLTISGLTSATQYQAQVYAVSSGGPGAASIPITFTTSPGPPGQVTGLVETTATINSISIAWNAVPGTDSYQTQYRINGSGNAWTIGPNVTATSTTIANLVSNNVYDITVYAVNSNGPGALSSTLTVGTVGSPPGLVTNLTSTSIGQNDIAISWSNPITGNGPFAFSIQYAVNTTPISYQTFSGTISLNASGGACDITALAAGVNYLIQVAASNLGGNGAYATPLSVSTLSGPPNQVTGLVTSSVTSTSVTLTWNPVINAVTYQVQFQQDGQTLWTNYAVVTAPTVTATVSALTAGLTYNFRVYAIGP